MALESFVGALPGILQALPDIFLGIQVIVYTGLILFFGHIALFGYRGYTNFLVNLLARLGLGFLALIGGYAIGRFIPVPQYLQILQVNVMIGGLIYSFLLLIAIYLAMHNVFNVSGIKGQIERLQNMLAKASELGKLTRKERLRDPQRIAGIVLIGVFIIIAAVYFQGFPNYYEEIIGSFGVTPDDVSQLAGELAPPTEECPSLLNVAVENGDAMRAGTLTPSSDQAAKAIMEQNTGEEVLIMYYVTSDGQEYSAGLTINRNLCLADSTKFCGCISV